MNLKWTLVPSHVILLFIVHNGWKYVVWVSLVLILVAITFEYFETLESVDGSGMFLEDLEIEFEPAKKSKK